MNTLLPAVIETAIKPKPTKDELLTAMARLHIEKIIRENVTRKETQEAADTKIERMLFTLVRKKGLGIEPTANWYYYNQSRPSASVTFKFREQDLSEEIIGLMKLSRNNEQLVVPDIHHAKKEVRSAMGELVCKDSRVDALLADAGSRAALEKALEAISQ